MSEHVLLAGEIGTRSSRNFAATYRRPRFAGSALTPELRIFQVINSQMLHSSWSEALRGVSLAVTRCVLCDSHTFLDISGASRGRTCTLVSQAMSSPQEVLVAHFQCYQADHDTQSCTTNLFAESRACCCVWCLQETSCFRRIPARPPVCGTHQATSHSHSSRVHANDIATSSHKHNRLTHCFLTPLSNLLV